MEILSFKNAIIIIVSVGINLTSFVAISQSGNFRDHPLLDRFPDSEIAEIEFDEDINYRLVLSSLQRIRGLVSPELSERLRGDVTKILYEVSNEFNGQDVYDFFRQQLQDRSYLELFTCAGRECGSSNYWANDIFGNRILYGPERNQFYMAMRTGLDTESASHLALYIITRGNRRLYAYLEIVEVDGAETRIDLVNPTSLATLLEDQGFIILSGIEFENDLALSVDSDLSAIVNMLQANPSFRIYLVAHLSEGDEFAALIERSQQRANMLRELLITRGIEGNRIVARGVGPLAPSCNVAACTDRVEIVLQ